jgi:hypothetical protein
MKKEFETFLSDSKEGLVGSWKSARWDLTIKSTNCYNPLQGGFCIEEKSFLQLALPSRQTILNFYRLLYYMLKYLLIKVGKTTNYSEGWVGVGTSKIKFRF